MTDPADCPPEDPPPTPMPTDAGGTIWDAANQQVVRADQSGPGWNPARTATAGIPGTWGPAGLKPPVTPPATQTDVIQGKPVAVTASPTSAWTTGQYVQTQTAGAAGRVCWTGSNWVGGVAP